MLLCRYAKWKFAGKYEVKRTMDKVQNSARSARMMNDEGRLALVETICAQRSELFIRTSYFVNRTSLQLPICGQSASVSERNIEPIWAADS